MLRSEIGIYIKSNLKISIDKVFQNISYGGLGMINVKNYIEGLRVGLYKKTFSSTDFWAKEIKQYRVNADFVFHFSNNVNTNTPCRDIVHSIKTFINAFHKINGNIYNAHIFESKILKLMNHKLLGWNHFR